MFPHPRVGRKGAGDEDVSPPSGPATGEDAGTGTNPDTSISLSTRERLSLMELVVAELGGWAGAICYRCHLPAGPFLVSDGVVHMDLAVFRVEMREREEPSIPE
ncbi:MAG TPA: hypothetical protein VF116_13135 [Ktedonobacterales bacterium]